PTSCFSGSVALGSRHHVDPAWLETQAIDIEGADIPINRYFLNHPEMVLGNWSRQDRLYDDGYSLKGNGELRAQLQEAIARLPEGAATAVPSRDADTAPRFTPPPLLPHITEGSFFVHPDRSICQMVGGVAQPVNYGGTRLAAGATMTGRRIAA